MKVLLDIAATAIGFYFGFQVFLWLGEMIPWFGYFPIGFLAGITVMYLCVNIFHAIELLITWSALWIYHKLS